MWIAAYPTMGKTYTAKKYPHLFMDWEVGKRGGYPPSRSYNGRGHYFVTRTRRADVLIAPRDSSVLAKRIRRLRATSKAGEVNLFGSPDKIDQDVSKWLRRGKVVIFADNVEQALKALSFV